MVSVCVSGLLLFNKRDKIGVSYRFVNTRMKVKHGEVQELVRKGGYEDRIS